MVYKYVVPSYGKTACRSSVYVEACADTLCRSDFDCFHASFLGDIKLSLRDTGYSRLYRGGR